MPTPDPSAALTAFQEYVVGRDAANYELGQLLVWALVFVGFAVCALLAGALVTTGLRR